MICIIWSLRSRMEPIAKSRNRLLSLAFLLSILSEITSTVDPAKYNTRLFFFLLNFSPSARRSSGRTIFIAMINASFSSRKLEWKLAVSMAVKHDGRSGKYERIGSRFAFIAANVSLGRRARERNRSLAEEKKRV